MGGLFLYDALTVAARRMSSCCVQVMNKEIGDRPRAPHVQVEASGDTLTVTVACPACKARNVVKTDGVRVSVDRSAATAG